MASWHEISPDPDIKELSNIATGAQDVRADDDTDDALHAPADSGDYTMNRLDASDLTDDLTGSFNDENGLPRS